MEETLTEVIEVVETINTENVELLIIETNRLLTEIHTLLTTQSELIGHIYAGVLYCFALVVPLVVCVLLYTFFKKFM